MLDHNNYKILIVDDYPTNIRVLYDFFKLADYQVLTAKSGQEALSVIHHNPPHIILLDVMMPEMNGFDVCRLLKQNEETREIPVIFITALSETKHVLMGFEAGGVDYVTKPFNQAEILARVNSQLELRAAREELKKEKEQIETQAKQLATAYDKMELLNLELEQEKIKNEKLLLNILPRKIAHDLKKFGCTKPELFNPVTVLFSDLVEFTSISTLLNPTELIGELNDLYTGFDDIMIKNSCERIETIGDAYLAVCGMPEPNDRHAHHMVNAAREMVQFLHQRNEWQKKLSKQSWQIRIGLHSGSLVGGVVGTRKYSYNVFGDTVNTASRMQSNSEPMRVNLSESAYELVKHDFIFSEREPLEVKGKGSMKMYYLED